MTEAAARAPIPFPDPVLQLIGASIDRFLRATCQVLDRELRADAVQTAWLLLLQRQPELRIPTPAALLACLRAFARNALRNLLRRERRRRACGGELPPALPTAVDPLQTAIAREQVRRVATALRSLPREQRALVLQLGPGGRTHAAVAASLGRSELATRSLLRRVRRQLDRAIADHLAPDSPSCARHASAIVARPVASYRRIRSSSSLRHSSPFGASSTSRACASSSSGSASA
jgi:RNA polymerase sigma factor (sigma-70 family)